MYQISAFLFACLALFVSSHDLTENFSLRPRKNAPLFKAKAVLNDKFIDVSLKQYSEAGKWTVLLFYPFDYTFVCPVSRWFLLIFGLLSFFLICHRLKLFHSARRTVTLRASIHKCWLSQLILTTRTWLGQGLQEIKVELESCKFLWWLILPSESHHLTAFLSLMRMMRCLEPL